MAHIFFERLEKRQSTQTLYPLTGGNTAIAIYSAPLPDSGWGSIGYYNPLTPQLLYGISPPSTYPSGGYFPWSSGLFGMSGYSPYSPFSSWTNPFFSYNSWNSWGSGGSFSPIWNYLGGLFGGSFPWSWGGSWGGSYPGIPDIRLLYGIPSPIQPPTNITTFYGVGTPISPSLPPVDIVTYYGITLPTFGLY